MSAVRTLGLTSINFEPKIFEFLVDKTKQFISEHNDQAISELALVMYGVSGSLEVYFETLDNAHAQIEKYPDYAAKDSYGAYNGNPADYKYGYGLLEFHEWHAWYYGSAESHSDGELPLRLIDQNGVTHDFSDGTNNPISEVVSRCAVPVVKEYARTNEFNALKKENIVRLGVAPWDCSDNSYWVHEAN